MYQVQSLSNQPSAREWDELAQMMRATVDGGGSISYVAPFPLNEALAFWQRAANALSWSPA
jgi:hypothetical protein